jgi:hypothetical protein
MIAIKSRVAVFSDEQLNTTHFNQNLVPILYQNYTIFTGKAKQPIFFRELKILTFPVIFFIERLLVFPLPQSPIFSSGILIKSGLLKIVKRLKPLFCGRFQT